MANAWAAPCPAHLDPLSRLGFLLAKTARALQSWSDRRIGNVRRQLLLAKELILRLDVAQESRLLSDEEFAFRAELKLIVLGLASLERTMARQRSRVLWIPPPHGAVKGNCDGALDRPSGRSAAAAIFRTEDGRFMGASVLVSTGIVDPECVEAMACREALCLRQDLQISGAVIASDCKGVIQSIEGGTRGINAMIIEDIRQLKLGSDGFLFRHEQREANFDAHNIAKNSLVLDPGRHVWFLEPPGYVNPNTI